MHSYDHRFSPQYFIDKFSAIPADQFITGSYHSLSGRACANGHCGCDEETVTPEATGLQLILAPLHITQTLRDRNAEVKISFKPFTKECLKEGYSFKAQVINDGQTDQYKETTPKERILAALHDAKAWWDNYEMEQQTNWAVQAVNDQLTTTPVKHSSMLPVFAGILILFSLLLLGSCTASRQSGCHATSGKVGYR